LTFPPIIDICAKSLFILFISLSYQFARLLLPRLSALLSTAAINSSFIIAWQSTAGYVDISRAIFELAALITLIKYQKHNNSKLILLAAIFFGFALSVKIQATIALVAILVYLFATRFPKKHVLTFVSTIIVTASIWYLYNWLYTGNFLYPLNLITKQTDQLTHAGASSPMGWFIHQTFTLPKIIWDISFNYSRLLTPIITLLLPIAWINRNFLFKKQLPLLLYSVCYLLLWWYLPPPENRYLIGLLPALTVLILYAVIHLPPKFKSIKTTSF